MGLGRALFSEMDKFGQLKKCRGIYLPLKMNYRSLKVYKKWLSVGFTDKGIYEWEEKPGKFVNVHILEREF